MSDLKLTVVGIGASAGGLDAFRMFFEAMPPDSGLAFVVVLHLPAHRKSMLPEILARWTTMPVQEVIDGMVIEPNRVYVPPPHAATTIQGGRLRVRLPAAGDRREDRPIDGFFDSLASSLRENAVGIVLSGTGSDGALGLKAIKACGGLTLVQGSDGSRPQYDGMPLGAIATGAVDMVASVEGMPDHLIRLHRMRQQVTELPAVPPEQVEAARLAICAILRGQLGHDFSGYKDKTFLRRVQRRMQVLNIEALPDYVVRLEQDRDEVVLLFKDLLIRVTSFFKDGETFEVLAREVMPRLFEGQQADGTVRIWVPACATGEEAYSLAILLREHMDGLRGPPKVQVFATDIDEPAIVAARAGRYPATLLQGLSPARLERFFKATENTYVVAKEIRDLCTFSTHSVVRDPPFSRMNMISCRNLLIYLDTGLQASVIPAFHYSLLPRGILLLGSSETTSRHEELFMPLDKAARIFERRDVRSPPPSLLPSGRKPPARSTPRTVTDEPVRLPAGRDPHDEADPQHGRSEHPSPSRRTPGMHGLVRLAEGGLRSGLRTALRQLSPVGSEIDRLRAELRDTQVQLQSVTEEHGTAVEELRSANEELHSVNEEVQSTNEELETSKEEIQSVNEELHTVNAQLSEKVEELDRTASDLKNLFDSTEVATVFLDRHLVIRGFTPAVSGIYNLIPSDQGRPLTDIVSHLRYDGLREDVRTVLDTLEPLERQVTRDDGGIHYIMRILPYRTPDSAVDGTLVTFLDVTSVVQAENHQRLLVDELNHRVKNMLTVVISLASQTLRRAETLQQFSVAFMGRITALTASYSLLSRANWTDVPLREVLMEETRPFLARDRRNIVLEGPRVQLSPQAALALGMAIHELATNAVKYGALSVPQGTVEVTWQVEQDEDASQFVLEWIESGGPPVAAPLRQGFGTTLIERGFAHELSGSASIQFVTEGVRATLRAPLGSALSVAPVLETAARS